MHARLLKRKHFTNKERKKETTYNKDANNCYHTRFQANVTALKLITQTQA